MDGYPSIFGVEAPQFVSGEDTIELDYVTISRDDPDLKDIEHKSIRTGHKEWTNKGKHWTFEVLVNICKYPNSYEKYQELKAFNNTLVDELFKRRDGSAFKNNNGVEVKFFIEEMEEFYYKHYLYPDRLRILFISQDPIDLAISTGSSSGVPDNHVIPETIMEMYGESWDGSVMDGNYIGPSLTEAGSVASATDAPANSKKALQTNNTNEYLSFTSLVNADADNYVIFLVGRQAGSISTGYIMYGLDFRDNSSIPIILLPICWSGGNDQWAMYINNNIVTTTGIGKNTDDPHIRCLILQNNNADLYIDGGSSILNAAYSPVQFGGTNYARLNQSSTGSLRFSYMHHQSVHKFPSDKLVDLTWLNNYGNALAAYYGLSWTNITGI